MSDLWWRATRLAALVLALCCGIPPAAAGQELRDRGAPAPDLAKPSPPARDKQDRALEAGSGRGVSQPESGVRAGEAEATTGAAAADATAPHPADNGPDAEPSARMAREAAPQNGAGDPAPVKMPKGPATEQAGPRRAPVTLKVATWDSAYNKAQQRVLFEPFTTETSHDVDIVSHGGDFAGLTPGRVKAEKWDLIEVDVRTAQRGCADGWLSEVGVADLPAGVEGDSPGDDYLPGAMMPCAVASAAWAAVAVYDTRAEFDEAPRRVADLFDLERFPGKRALPRQAPYLLELALLADGIAPDAVYKTLATPSGADRAFARLSSIRHAIAWWGDAARALDAFPARPSSGADEVVMALAFNGRVFTSAVREQPGLRILWDGQIYRFNYWAIPESAPNKRIARDLLRHVSLPERQARVAQLFPYGPVRRSALPLVRQHAEIKIDMADFVPTMPGNMRGALRFEAQWWDQNGAALKERFADWLKLPTPRVPADQLVPPVPVKAARPS